MKFTSIDINSNNCWQIGTGDETRSYFDIFIKYGVALVGPGDPGREGDPKTRLFYTVNPDIRNWGAVLKKVKEGEWIIARKGKKSILAVGKVIEEINHGEFFSDVEGWDLQHYIKVKWYLPNTPNNIIQLSKNLLSQSTLHGCNKQEVYDKIYSTDFKEAIQEFELEDFIVPEIIDHTEVMKMLIEEGLRIQDAENIALTIQRIIKLVQWYKQNDNETLEHEIIAFLILPLLIALGWSEQKIKLEYQGIDIALFSNAFKGNYKLTPEYIVEAKTFSNGLAFTEQQLETYAKKYPECKNFVATNGYRYKIFIRDKSKFILKGYFNLLKLTERNVLYDVPLDTVQSIYSISNLQ